MDILYVYDIGSMNLHWSLDEVKHGWVLLHIYGTKLMYECNKVCTRGNGRLLDGVKDY